ncbi:MAG: hypothetical protein HQ567_06660 [Candidatus Nealsonbacteria bacterium]|nr:hypothetical protein [Candidatus Nealsonbacteria bacterium]
MPEWASSGTPASQVAPPLQDETATREAPPLVTPPDELDELDPDEVTPCTTCNSLELWWDVVGGQHCMICDPPHKGRRLRRAAQRLRERADRQLQREGA